MSPQENDFKKASTFMQFSLKFNKPFREEW